MSKEIEGGEEGEEDGPKKSNSNSNKRHLPKKAPSNHQSVDDMDFNDPEYVQMWESEKREANRKAAIEEAEKNDDKTKEEEKNGVDADENDNEEAEDEEASGSEGEEEADEDEEEADEDEEEEEDDEDGEDEDDDEDLEDEDNDDEVEGQNGNHMNDDSAAEIESETEEASKKLKVKKEKKSTEQGEQQPKDKATLLNELKRHMTAYKSLFQKSKLDTAKMLELTKSIYDLTFANATKSGRNEPSPFIAVFKDLIVDINSEFLRQRQRERRFPKLSTVSCHIIRLILLILKKNF